MPHCDLVLYENLFRENWSAARLANVLLIANRLSEYAERCVPTVEGAGGTARVAQAPFASVAASAPFLPEGFSRLAPRCSRR